MVYLISDKMIRFCLVQGEHIRQVVCQQSMGSTSVLCVSNACSKTINSTVEAKTHIITNCHFWKAYNYSRILSWFDC